MKRLIYQVYVGDRSRLYDFCVASVADYCRAHSIEHRVQREPILRIKPNPKTSGRSEQAVSRLGYLPIFEKENALALLGEFDQVAVIDSDVWIRPYSPNVFDHLFAQWDFGAVVEREMPLTDRYRQKVRRYSEALIRPLSDVDWEWDESGARFANMGVMVMNASLKRFLDGQTPREFLERPEFQKFVDGRGHLKWSTDQILLNWWIRKAGVRFMPLHWKWNALYRGVDDLSASEAHFVHFFLRDHLPGKGENVEKLARAV